MGRPWIEHGSKEPQSSILTIIPSTLSKLKYLRFLEQTNLNSLQFDLENRFNKQNLFKMEITSEIFPPIIEKTASTCHINDQFIDINSKWDLSSKKSKGKLNFRKMAPYSFFLTPFIDDVISLINPVKNKNKTRFI